MRVVNLSSRPFVNERPVVRVSLVLWVLGGLLLAVNIYSYSTYWLDSEEIRGEVAEVREAIDRQEEDLAELTRRASAVDVQGLNEHAIFLNHLIRYRTFPWGKLFDELEDVLPKTVRLMKVQPVVERQQDVEPIRQRGSRTSRRRSSRDEPPPPAALPEPMETQEIPMSLRGVAKTDDDILDFVDLLFEHPSFRDPNFERETLREQEQEVVFEMSVIYLLELADDAGAPTQVADSGAESPGVGLEGEGDLQRDEGEVEAEGAAIARTTFDGEEPRDDQPDRGAEPLREPPGSSRRAPGLAAGVAGVAGEDSDDPVTPLTPSQTRAAQDAPRRDAERPPTRSGAFPVTVQQGAGGRGPSATPTAESPPTAPPAAERQRPGRATRPPSRADAPPDDGPDEAEDEPGRRPRFVEPNASGTQPIFPGGGS